MFSPKSFYSVLSMLCVGMFIVMPAKAVSVPSLSDIPADTPLAEAMEYLMSRGIKGYPDGTFKPANGINRMEFLTMTLKVLGQDPGTALRHRFPDVPEKEWYAPVVSKARELELVKGNPDGTFAPLNAVTLIDGLVILSRAYKVNPDNCRGPVPSGIQGWVAPYFSCATEHGVLDAAKSHKADAQLTRGQAALLQYAYFKGIQAKNALTAEEQKAQNALKAALEAARSRLNESGSHLKEKRFDQAQASLDEALAKAREAMEQSQDPNVVGLAKYIYAQKKLVDYLKNRENNPGVAAAALAEAIATARQVNALAMDDNLKKAAQTIVNIESAPEQAVAVATTGATVSAERLQGLLNLTEARMTEAIQTLMKKDIAGARRMIDESVGAAKSARDLAPDNVVVTGAAKVAYAMKQFIAAYELALKAQFNDAKGVAQESIATARQSKELANVPASIVSIADQIINEFAGKLIADIDKKQASIAP